MSRLGLRNLDARPYDRKGLRFSKHAAARPAPKERPNGTDYGFMKPRRMLVAVKEGMMHPKPPTYRRLDMDNNACKLPLEHCRTSTSRTAEDFRQSSITFFKKPEHPLSSTRITETGRALTVQDYRPYAPNNPDELRGRSVHDNYHYDKDIDEIVPQTTIPARRMIPDESVPRPPFTGYSMRYLDPKVTTGRWRYQYTLKPETGLDFFGPRPLPADTFSRYRNSFPMWKNNITTKAWY